MMRRTFMTGLTAGVLATPAHATQPVDVFDPARVVLVIPDIGPSADPATLKAALQALVEHALPVNLVVRPGDGSGTVLAPDQQLAEVLRSFSGRFPGLIEITAWAPDLGRKQPFEMARDAMEARSGLIAAIWGADHSTALSTAIVSIATDFAVEQFSVADVISAGFQNVIILPGADVPAGARLAQGGVLTILGGSATDLDGAERLVAQARGSSQVQIVLRVAAFERNGQGATGSAIARLAQTVRSQELAGRVTAVLVRELLMRTDARYRRRLALHLFDAPHGDAAAASAVLAFRRTLDGTRIRYSVGKPIAGAEGAWSVDEGYWIALPTHGRRSTGTRSGSSLTHVNRAPGTDSSGWQSEVPLEPGVALLLSAGLTGKCGLDEGSSLHVPVLPYMVNGVSAGNPAFAAPEMLGEGLILIDPGTIATGAQRNIALRKLRKLIDGDVAELVPFDQYVADRMPTDPVIAARLLTDRYRAKRRSSPGLAPDNRDDLLADAATAWKYFERGTNARTGLCESTTVNGEPASGFISVTMWEVGSQFNALMAALDLALIDDDAFTSQSRAILAALERALAAGRSLPPEWIDTQTGKSSRNFNSFDTGRLLMALDRLRRHRLQPKGIDKLVASWDFGRIIQNRRLHSIKDRVLIDDNNSNYTEYAATGYRAWGFDVTSPFEFLTATKTADQQMALLYTASKIGPIGAEPALLEVLDRGRSASADYLADVLFAAQADLFDRTGQLVFPSESPLDRPPWFSFQGFDIGSAKDRWTIKFDSTEPEFQTAAFKRDTRANSSKAAYLWHALRPGALSHLMVAGTRSVARSSFGFLSAVYLANQRPTQMYSDLNTNSVILQSIAAMN